MKSLDSKSNSHEINGYFDEHGRCIPNSLTKPVYKTSRRYFLCEQPRIDYRRILENINQYLNEGQPTISPGDFEERCQGIMDNLVADPLTKNIRLGVHVPFVLPQREYTDIGNDLDSIFLPAVHRSFEGMFPDRAFVNHSSRQLAGSIEVQEGSRHRELIEENCEKTVVGLYFPCLSEYSIPAAVEQLGSLPKNLVLAGGYDTCAAFVACPDLLLRLSGYPPLLWMTGIRGHQDGFGYQFEAYGYNLTFNRRAHLGKVAEYWSSGLICTEQNCSS